MDSIQSAVRATIKLGAGVSIDGYMMNDGRFRYGLAYTSLLLGYADNYYRRLFLQRTKKPSKKLKALQDKGFTAYQIDVRVPREEGRGSSVARTVSFDDFCLLVEYEAEIGNLAALALLTSSFRELLKGRTQVAFGIEEDSLEQRQADFQAHYDAYLSDREDLENLWLPGDEMYYPTYRDWEAIKPWEIKQKRRKAS